jgi:hypothetical protein
MGLRRGDKVFRRSDSAPMKVIWVGPDGHAKCERRESDGKGKLVSLIDLYARTEFETCRERTERVAEEEAIRQVERAREAKEFDDRVEKMRVHALTRRPSDVLRLLIEMIPETGSAHIIFHFKKAFPLVPLRNCIDAQGPAQLYEGGISDEKFDALFAPWWPSGQSDGNG